MTGATATFTGCGKEPVESLVPMLIPPPHFSPGKSLQYATTCRECTAGCGLMVTTREGRAIKIEGNPLHPINKGKVCAIGQAALQGLYSPARIPGPLLRKGQTTKAVGWLKAIDLFVNKIKESQSDPNGRILFIGPPETGTMRKLIQNCLRSWGGGDYINFDLSPVHSYKKANLLAFGTGEIPQIDLSQVDTLVNFGSDFLETWLSPLKFSREYTDFHAHQGTKKGRFVQVSPYLSLTGVNADQWFSCSPGSEWIIACQVARQLSDKSLFLTDREKSKINKMLDALLQHVDFNNKQESQKSVNALVEEFKSKRCLCLAGGNSSADQHATLLHTAVNLINYITGEVNRSVAFGADVKAGGDSLKDIKSAFSALGRKKYSLVIINNVNPVFALPQLKDLASTLADGPFIVSLSTSADETSKLASLHLPTHHYLESWGDAKPMKHATNLQQPVMRPIPGYDTKELGDLLLQVSQLINPVGFEFKNFYEYLLSNWQSLHKQNKPASSFEAFWKNSLARGGVYRETSVKNVSLAASPFNTELIHPEKQPVGMSLLVVNSPFHHANGHTGDRYWLLEVPHPVSQVAWDSWVEINPETARKLGIVDNDLLKLTSSHGSVDVAVRLYHGVAPNTLVMPAGLGRIVSFPDYPERKGRLPLLDLFKTKKQVGLTTQTIGENALSLFSDRHDALSGDFIFSQSGIQIHKTGKKQILAIADGQDRFTVSDHGINQGNRKARGLYRTVHRDSEGNLEPEHVSHHSAHGSSKGFYQSIDKNVAKHKNSTVKTPPDFFTEYKWEMVIDLDRCTGCSACVIACYAENNIAVVGKTRVIQGREMSWLRIERFFEHNPKTDSVQTYLFPQMCAQCDNAGCEPVCPVSATYKTSDGLNAMIYARCVGSRYCSNNCIYSQRRFSWRDYEFPSPLHYQLNPDVSVRGKGLMEKCTFCFQRIRSKTLQAKKENRSLDESEVQTACQQTCPTNAIRFGNIKQANSEINKLKSDSLRSYTQFESMNFQPAITYLKKVIANDQ